MVILGSSSPRRIELLKKLVPEFKLIKPTFDENLINKNTRHLALKEAKNKAFSIKNLAEPQDFLICCDTIVKYKNIVLTKPKDLNEAKKYLQLLSGKRHAVISGVAIFYKNKHYFKEVKTYVFFNNLSDELIENYIHTINVLDKAGAYAIQDDGKFNLIKKIKGDKNNVIGFPLFYIEKILKQNKLI